jgi:hypothetical protein
MKEIKNLNQKRVCDVSEDNKTILIQLKDCITKITANGDKTLKITQERLKPNN